MDDKKINSNVNKSYSVDFNSNSSYSKVELLDGTIQTSVPHAVNKANNLSNKVDEMDLSLELELLPIIDIAKEVVNGKWGNGDERKKRLEEAGYNVAEVQGMVNEILTGVNTYIASEPIIETKDEPIVESLIETSSSSNSMEPKRNLMSKNNDFNMYEFPMKEIDNSTDTYVSSQTTISNSVNNVSEVDAQVDFNEVIKTVPIENMYNKLSDTSKDENKFMWFFGENKTTGLNGELILFDEKKVFGDSILYYKDGKNIKSVYDDHVIISDGANAFVYYKDGSWEIYNEYTEETTYYDSNGIKIKEKIIDRSEGIMSSEIKHYDQKGNVVKIEIGSSFKEFDSYGNLIAEKKYDGTYTEYDKDGKIIKIVDTHGYITEYKDDGSSITYDSDGNKRRIDGNDGSSISWHSDGTLYQVIQADGTKITHYDGNKYQVIFPDGNGKIYEVHENGNVKRESTPYGSGPYDWNEKIYDEVGNLVSEKYELGKITYSDGKPASFEFNCSNRRQMKDDKITVITNNSGDYIIKLNQDGTKVLEITDIDGNIIHDFGSGITLIK